MRFITNEQVDKLQALARDLARRGRREESRTIIAVLGSAGGAEQEYSATEAAAILGVTSQTVHNWVRAEILPGWQDPTNHYFMPRQALEHTLALRAALPGQSVDISDDEIDAEIEAVRAERRARTAGR